MVQGTENGSHSESDVYQVSLYVYDLSNGLARSLSRQLTGRHFDAIYHTSIVVHGREWYFGQGIFCSSTPGNTHFGRPIETIALGNTSVDPDTLQEIMADLRERFTAAAYHLLRFNCNTFSNELANILVGRDIPSHITSLPQDFLATPFGQMMGPQIDAMFRGGPAVPSAGGFNAASAPTHPSAVGILNNVTQQALANGHSSGSAHASAVRHIASIAQFEQLKRSQPSAVIMFTSQTCPPCVQLHPVYESMAEEYSDAKRFKQRPIVFGLVESSSQSSQLMMQQGISATPTFQFFQDGNMVEQLKGASPSSLKDGVEALLWRRHRPHPHSRSADPSALLPSSAIEYKTIPNLTLAEQKLDEITGKFKASSFAEKADMQDARATLTKTLLPWIKGTLAVGKTRLMAEADCIRWVKGARQCIELLPVKDMFPVIDLVRIAMLDEQQVKMLTQSDNVGLIDDICAKVKTQLQPTNKATILTTLRLLGNLVASSVSNLGERVVQSPDVTTLLVYGLLSEDAGIRTAAINSAFNWASLVAGERGSFVSVPSGDGTGDANDVDKEVEVLCAVMECTEKEQDLERLHRATATLTVLLYRISAWEATVKPLLDVIGASKKLEEKAVALQAKDDSNKVTEVKRLLGTAAKLCKAA